MCGNWEKKKNNFYVKVLWEKHSVDPIAVHYLLFLFEYNIVTYSGSIHDGTLLLSQFNAQLLITVHNSSTILTHEWQILELQQLRVMSSGF
jgi:hypothetical protein